MFRNTENIGWKKIDERDERSGIIERRTEVVMVMTERGNDRFGTVIVISHRRTSQRCKSVLTPSQRKEARLAKEESLSFYDQNYCFTPKVALRTLPYTIKSTIEGCMSASRDYCQALVDPTSNSMERTLLISVHVLG